VIGFSHSERIGFAQCALVLHLETLPPDSTSGHFRSATPARRLVAVGPQEWPAGTPYMVGSRLPAGLAGRRNVPSA